MGFDAYKICIPLPNGDMLCFNESTEQAEIVEVKIKPLNLRLVPKAAIIKLKEKVDARGDKQGVDQASLNLTPYEVNPFHRIHEDSL